MFQSSIATNVTNAVSLVYHAKANAGGWVGIFLGDTLRLQGVIFGFGIGVATAVAFLYLYILRIPGCLFFTIWGIMLSILFFFVIGSILLYTLASKYKANDHPMYEVYTMQGFAIGGFVISFLYLCLLIVMRKRVQLAIGVVKEAARALGSMPFLILMPVMQVVAMVIFLIPWVIYLFYLASSGEVVTKTVTTTTVYGETSYSVRSFQYTKNTKIAFIYMLFCWFWSSEFFIAVGQLIIALSLVAWYFNRDKSTVGNTTVFWVSV
jgi:choline transporter-like protein 2/4/5